jgi:hypothetical protein
MTEIEIPREQLVREIDMTEDGLYIYCVPRSQYASLEKVTPDSLKKLRCIPDTLIYTDGENLFKTRLLQRMVRLRHPTTNDVIDTEYATIHRVWVPITHFQVKERSYNGKPMLYWVSNNGMMIPIAHMVATCFLGPKPKGHTLVFSDGDYTNTKPENLRWMLKTKPDGKVRYVVWDKSKERYRVTHPSLPRKVFRSEDEAIKYLTSQQVTISYVNSEDTDSTCPSIVMPDDSDTEEPVADVIDL